MQFANITWEGTYEHHAACTYIKHHVKQTSHYLRLLTFRLFGNSPKTKIDCRLYLNLTTLAERFFRANFFNTAHGIFLSVYQNAIGEFGLRSQEQDQRVFTQRSALCVEVY